jgi:hypothetical protein
VSSLKDYEFSFDLDDKSYKLVFNLNVMEVIQNKYGSVQKWARLTDNKKGEVNAKALIFGLTEMMNEAIDIENDEKGLDNPLLTTKQVGRIITRAGIKASAEKLNKVITESVKDEHPKNI